MDEDEGFTSLMVVRVENCIFWTHESLVYLDGHMKSSFKELVAD